MKILLTERKQIKKFIFLHNFHIF